MAKQILDISTFIDRPEVHIDGERIEMLNRNELSVLDGLTLAKWRDEMEALEDAMKDAPDPPTDEFKTKADRHLALARKYVSKVTVDLPAATMEKLKGSHLAAIVIHFHGLPQSVPIPEAMMAKARQSRKLTGAKSSRG